jgi:TPP-dependent pyruvate/acetoin dehydrogenase alpha subunit
VPDIASRAAGYAMPGVIVDGQDVLACYRASVDAVTRARAGEGPSLIEAKTYRFHEHAYGLAVPVPYRDQAEVESWPSTVDPITLFIDRLLGWQLVDEDAVRQVRADVEVDVAHAVEFARESPYPPPEAAYADLYADSPQLEGVFS